MLPSRSLDALVAEKVMGLRIKYKPNGEPYPANDYLTDKDPPEEWGRVKDYSSDIAAAWEVARHMFDKHDLLFSLRQRKSGQWRAMFFTSNEEGKTFKAVSDSEAHAICVAALKAVGVEI